MHRPWTQGLTSPELLGVSCRWKDLEVGVRWAWVSSTVSVFLSNLGLLVPHKTILGSK